MTTSKERLADVRRFLAEGPDDEDAPPLDGPVGEMALFRGYITQAQLEECLREQRASSRPLPLGEVLLRRKYLTSEQLLRLLARQKRFAPTAPPLHVGRYRLIRKIGRGGMGVVYEAEDPELRRRVALKLLKEGEADPAAVERFRREAAIAAQLRHPGIVGVHEIGTFEPGPGRVQHYIAMDLVDGKTLADLLAEGRTDRAELLRILEDVARAVAHAHSRGVVHRDLKPNNVLVEPGGRVMLSDFGIACAQSFSTPLTRTDMIVGTPQYMAPEQIEAGGAQPGPAADVYALGVLLFEVLTGRVPFDAKNPVKLFQKILSDAPTRPGRIGRRVGQDLEVICLKSLEKDPARRYPTAGEFAGDLELFRRGRPIAARASSVAYRIGRTLRRRRGLVAVAAAAALLLIALSAFTAGRVGREREEALRQMAGRLDTVLRAALDFRRAGDLAKMRTFAREAETVCADAVRTFPESAEPHALLGRVYRALMEPEMALAEQEKALAKDPSCARARYERVVLTARRYRKRVDDLVQSAWKRAGERLGEVRGTDLTVPSRETLAKGDPAARELGARMEEDLRLLESADAAGIGPGERACARGLLAWLSGNRSLARRFLQESVKGAPLLDEGYEALATLESEEQRYEEAILALTAGLERDRGYLPYLENRGIARLTWGYDKTGRGEKASPLFREAIADFTTLLDLDPRREDAYRYRGLAYFLDGHVGGFILRDDPTPLYEAAVHDLSKAIEVNPRGSANWMWRGVVRFCWGAYKGLKMERALPLCEDALKDLTEAIRCNPDGDEAYMWRALGRVPVAFFKASQRQDVEPDYRESLRDFEEALRRNPGRGEAWLWRGVTHALWALHLIVGGRDPAEAFHAAAEDLEVAAQKLPQRSDAAEWKGRADVFHGMALERKGADGLPHFRKAADTFDRALARHPNSPGLRWGRAEARMRSGDHDGALRDLGDATEPYARGLRGETLARRAVLGADPEPDLTEALAEFRQALEGNPLLTEAWVWQGRARTLLADARSAREDPLPRYQEALGDFGRVLLFQPQHPEALRFRAELYERRGAWKASRNRPAKSDFQAALKDYTRLLELAPALEPQLRKSIDSCRAASGK